MATPHPHRRGILLLLGLLLGACSAGTYDISDCDPSVQNLEQDLCKPLNDAMEMSGCMLYQCDNVSHRCVVKPRDYDRDGDPDRACGGNDCDDTDPTVHSTAVEACDNKDNNCNGVKDEGCGCDPNLIGTLCYAGKGACERSVPWICSLNKPLCTAMAAASQTWHSYVDPVTMSADWNCNGMDEYACCGDMNCGGAVGCAKVDCAAIGTLCSQFCQAQAVQNCNGAAVNYRCNDICGAATNVCHCSLTFAFPPCQTSSISNGVVGCQ